MTGPSVHYFFRIASNLGVKEELISVIRGSTVVSRSDKPSHVILVVLESIPILFQTKILKGEY